MASLYYTYFRLAQTGESVRELPGDLREFLGELFTDFRSIGDGEWVGSSELAEMPLQHEFRNAVKASENVGLVWLSPVDLGRDQRWANEELAERFSRVRETVGIEMGSN